jgi:GWxTD domain-containing protein
MFTQVPKKMRRCVAVGAAVFATAVAAGADDGFYFDYAFFYHRVPEKVVVEFYVAVPLDRLDGTETAEGTTYNFNVGVQATPAEGGAAVANSFRAKTASVSPGEGVKAPLSLSQLEVAVPPGEYHFEIGVGDLGGGSSRVSTFDITVPAPQDGPFASGVELAGSIAPVEAGVEGEFIKAGLNVVPNPTKLVNDADATLPIYYELYGLPLGETGKGTFILSYDVSQLNGRRFVKVERALEVGAPDVVRAEMLDLKGVPPGSYELSVRVESRDGGGFLQTTKKFMVFHHASGKELAELQGKFMPYSIEDEKQKRHELALVASDDEMAAFDALPPEEKPIFVENFWARRDPDPTTPINEVKNAFYQRYYYVQERYSTPFREGVDTDMGRIYLKYGEPDEILRSPMGMRSEVTIDTSSWQSDPFEAWEYFTAGGVGNQYILFVFIDDDGDGSFRLDASTVPGYGRLIRSN